jgi:hypothetical protein
MADDIAAYGSHNQNIICIERLPKIYTAKDNKKTMS